MGDYFAHWLEIGAKLTNPPKIFNVNWFRTDDEGNFMWPGFGDNMRVLDWIIERSEDNVDAVEAPIGYLPLPEDINIEGLDMDTSDIEKLLAIDKEAWLSEFEGVKELYEKSQLVNPSVIVDTNHNNSGKKYLEQIRIAKDVVNSRNQNDDIKKLVKGLMIESYIEDGAQDVGDHVFGKSITDPCLGWEKTERLILDIADKL